ncbi:DUF1365 domain-containing protein [Rheinheimera baltica]|jgi:uncharacterized protein|uniref:DUF1365 domain-containing protein n=1 Tax=Rheinheimera baltica TaxID=67576 RepID=A0ABT9HZT7_9GAMM|nr:DUF1365 domain-containing protein [Rheinheimera baltica]MDP5136335.1 DUF1365 domain-containing protein [Rheinheimera baltica]MDP5151392.1 DUF1365 domain-containing protein [Rheinheimera baltica]
MQSGHAVYQGEVGHLRLLPREHGFSYPLAYYWLDSAALTRTALAHNGIQLERFGALSYRRKDYLTGASNIADAVRDKVKLLGGEKLISQIYLLTPLANWGLYFSPITLYYCYDAQNNFCYLLAEVTNTPWNERHYYLQKIQPEQQHYQHQKAFHVSPFNPMDMQYHWQISSPDDSLLCSIRNTQADKHIFSAWITLKRHSLTKQWRKRWLIRQPWQNVQVLLRIYWHALKLLVKRIPVHAHPKTKDTNA